MTDFPRLIEHAFPLKQASLDSVHEKNVRHGHISTLHIWPARRPLAACRAALIATLLPDPSAEPRPAGMSDAQWDKEVQRRRQELCERIGGKVEKRIERKTMPGGRVIERDKFETVGGVLHWHGEPKTKEEKEIVRQQQEDLEWFRQEIRRVYSRAPKVLDPFAGGGAIPLEAMRLGCEATAIDINPVAWFILKCTLEYPQKLAGQTRPLPEFILHNDDFMRQFFTKAKGYGKAETGAALKRLHQRLKKKTKGGQEDRQGSLPFAAIENSADGEIEADLAWHVRAWGQWVLDRARRDLARYYPVYADFEPLKPDQKAYEPQPMKFVPLKDDGTPDIDAINKDFTEDYLEDKRNPRWVAKPTVAYLWARAVQCKNCRATVPLLKTRWLCKKDKKRVLLTMTPKADSTGVEFGIETDVPVKGGNAAQRRENDKRIGGGTMSRSGAKCPCCGTITTTEDIRFEGKAGRLGMLMVAVVAEGRTGKGYRLPTAEEISIGSVSEEEAEGAFHEIPFGLPREPVPEGASRAGGGSPFTVHRYGMTYWGSLFTTRQLLSLGTMLKYTREAPPAARQAGYPGDWPESILAYLTLILDNVVNRSSALCSWTLSRETTRSTFARFALPINWDLAETAPLENASGGYPNAIDWAARYLDCISVGLHDSLTPIVTKGSAIAQNSVGLDVILTDPPYYDAIPYADLMDFFYIWMRRSLHGLQGILDHAFDSALSPKWDHEQNDGELIDDASRHAGDGAKSKAVYEDGMARAFQSCWRALADNGRLVIVFANKQPDAWEALVSAIIRAGFVADGSWPIQTEMGNRTRALSSAALASSVWLVCKRRSASAPIGWDNKVLEEMRANIGKRLQAFWDAGIRGPDFVWAATGPALEAYSKHPAVRKANQPNAVMTVSEFLNHARRIVVDYVVGQVLSGRGADEADTAAAERLDEPTAYYLLHRNDFGLDEAPVGTVILYAVSCGLSDRDLIDTWDLLAKTGGSSVDDKEDEEPDADSDEPVEETDSGGRVKLKTWAQRTNKSMGYEAPGGRPVPLIDRVHRLMHLWKAGDVHKVDEYLDDHGLRRQELFKRLLQSLIELSQPGTDERSLLESLSNHIGAKGARRDTGQREFTEEGVEWTASPSTDTE